MFLANLPGRRFRRFMACVFAALSPCLFASAAWAQAGGKDGLFLSVPNPISDAFVKEVEKTIETASKSGRKISVIIFDFNPMGPNGTSSYGNCRDLANYIEKLRHVKTVAYVSHEVTHHTVLPVLACQELVMASRDEETKALKAKIGNIGGPLDADIVKYYNDLAKSRGLGDLVGRMIDKNLPLKKIRKADGQIQYLSPQSIANLKDEKIVVEELPPGLALGNSLFDAELARSLSLCSQLIDSRAALAAVFQLPRKVLTENFHVGRVKVVWRIDFKGDTDRGSLDSLQRRLKRAGTRTPISSSCSSKGPAAIRLTSLRRLSSFAPCRPNGTTTTPTAT